MKCISMLKECKREAAAMYGFTSIASIVNPFWKVRAQSKAKQLFQNLIAINKILNYDHIQRKSRI